MTSHVRHSRHMCVIVSEGLSSLIALFIYVSVHLHSSAIIISDLYESHKSVEFFLGRVTRLNEHYRVSKTPEKLRLSMYSNTILILSGYDCNSK